MPGDTPFSWAEWVAEPPPPPNWLIPDMLEVGAVGYIHGAPSTFKSWLLLNLCLDLAAGREVWGKFPPAGRPLTTVMIQAEGSHDGWWRRLYGLRGEYPASIPFYSLHTANYPVDRAPTKQRVEGILDKLHPDLLVLDPLANLFSGSDTESEDIKRWTNLISEWRFKHDPLCALMGHHNRQVQRNRDGKVIDGGQAEARGKSELPAWADFIAALKRPDPFAPIVNVVVSKVREGFDGTPDQAKAKRAFRLEVVEGGKVWPAESERVDRREAAVMGVLGDAGPEGVALGELVQAIPGVEKRSARRLVDHMVEKGKVLLGEGRNAVVTIPEIEEE